MNKNRAKMAIKLDTKNRPIAFDKKSDQNRAIQEQKKKKKMMKRHKQIGDRIPYLKFYICI